MKKIFIACIALVLIGCGSSDADKANQDAELKEAQYNVMARGFVEASLKDADSAKFRNQKGFCGEVNAKNSFGAYTGFKRFVAVDKEMVVMEDAISANDFQKVWDDVCK